MDENLAGHEDTLGLCNTGTIDADSLGNAILDVVANRTGSSLSQCWGHVMMVPQIYLGVNVMSLHVHIQAKESHTVLIYC